MLLGELLWFWLFIRMLGIYRVVFVLKVFGGPGSSGLNGLIINFVLGFRLYSGVFFFIFSRMVLVLLVKGCCLLVVFCLRMGGFCSIIMWGLLFWLFYCFSRGSGLWFYLTADPQDPMIRSIGMSRVFQLYFF